MATSNKEWKMVCREYCRKNGFELLFVNDDDFGYCDQNGNLVHRYSADLLNEFKK